jgi:methylsterol monooxygenase
MIGKLLFCLICEDAWHYWAHRALHRKELYAGIHKLHHTFNAPFGFAAEYAHPIETIVLGVGFFIPLPFVCDHILVFWAWLLVRMMQTTDSHSGYDFPYFNPLYILPGYAGARFHDTHHSHFNGNYGSIFIFWDRLCNTQRKEAILTSNNETLVKNV